MLQIARTKINDKKVDFLSSDKLTQIADFSFTSGIFNEVGENTILAQGELISTQLFALLMAENGYKTKLLPALNFMQIDEDKIADTYFIRKNISILISPRCLRMKIFRCGWRQKSEWMFRCTG